MGNNRLTKSRQKGCTHVTVQFAPCSDHFRETARAQHPAATQSRRFHRAARPLSAACTARTSNACHSPTRAMLRSDSRHRARPAPRRAAPPPHLRHHGAVALCLVTAHVSEMDFCGSRDHTRLATRLCAHGHSSPSNSRQAGAAAERASVVRRASRALASVWLFGVRVLWLRAAAPPHEILPRWPDVSVAGLSPIRAHSSLCVRLGIWRCSVRC